MFVLSFLKAVVSNNIPNPTNVDGWIMGNVNQEGYYRVNYDVTNWNALTKQLYNDNEVCFSQNILTCPL